MTPTDEEKQRIQEAQLANPDVPLGTAEQFLFSLASISALTPRLQLWAFKLNYEALEKVSVCLSLTHTHTAGFHCVYIAMLAPPAGDCRATLRPEAGHGTAGVKSDV